MRKLILLLVLLLPSVFAAAQDIPEPYIKQALENNLVLKEKKTALSKSLAALKEARALFQPTTWLDVQYNLAQGGRSIEFPVGDLLNPVYKTLNQLTSSNSFPTVGNFSEQLLPNNFYDVRIKTTMPVLNPDLKINRDIKQQQISLKENEVEIYRRELVLELKTAYFKYLMSHHAIGIYENALQLVNQNLRVNQSLMNNGKGLPAYITRAESEVKNVESLLESARRDKQSAGAYFNFLLNTALTDSIAIADAPLKPELLQPILQGSDNINAREELKSLGLARDINGNQLKMNQSFKKPRLNAFLDLAAQGFDFRVNKRSFFYLGGFQLQVPIYSGKKNLYKIEQTTFEAQAIQLNTEQTRKQLELAAFLSRNNAANAYGLYTASLKKEEAAQKYFKLIDRGYKEGINSFIELLDARNQLTDSQLQSNIQKYKVLSALAAYERQTASYSFK